MKLASVQFELHQDKDGTYSVTREYFKGSECVLIQLMDLDMVAESATAAPLFKEFIEAGKLEKTA